MKKNGNRTKATITVITALLAIGLMAGLYCLSTGKDANFDSSGKQTVVEDASAKDATASPAAEEPAKEPEESGDDDKARADLPGSESISKTEAGKDTVYDRLEAKLRDDPDAKYEGFIVSLKETASDEDVQKLDEAIASGAPIAKLDHTERVYTASSVEDIKDVIDERLIGNIDPDYEVELLGWNGDTGKGNTGSGGEDAVSAASSSAPGDALYEESQYNLKAMNVPSVWAEGLEGQDVDADVDMNYDGTGNNDRIVVAVIDTGLNNDHEDLNHDRIIPGVRIKKQTETDDEGNKKDTFVTDPDFSDQSGHGTFTAGVIAAKKDNDIGIAGILQDAYVMPIRVFENGLTTSSSIVIAAVNYAAEQKETFDRKRGKEGENISVINLSVGTNSYIEEEMKACRRAVAAGIIVVSASGNYYNTSGLKPFYPAQFTMGVGSVGKDGKVSSFSQRLSESDGSGNAGDDFRRKLWVCAPGEDIPGLASGRYVQEGSPYCTKNGTSFSCPEVAALAALCKGIDNSLDQNGFMELLKDTAVPAEGRKGSIGGQDVEYGWGIVDFQKTRNGLLDEETTVTFDIRNELGKEIPGAAVRIRPVNESGEESDEIPPTDGKSWSLQKNRKYAYSVSSEGYMTCKGRIISFRENKTQRVVMEGTVKYPVEFHCVDGDGKRIGDPPTIRLYKDSGGGMIASHQSSFELIAGKYRYSISDDSGWVIDNDSTVFEVDPETDTPEKVKEITVTLSKAQTDPSPGEANENAGDKDKSGGGDAGEPSETSLPSVGAVSVIEAAGNYKKKTFTVRFKAASGATDYVLQWRKRSGKWKTKWTGGKTVVTTGKLAAGGMYDVRILPCRKSDGAYGDPSETKRLLMKETGVKKAKGGKKKFTVRWKKTAGATGYQILYSKSRNLKNAKIKTVGKKKKSCTVRGLKKGRWYVAVRPIKKSGGTYIGIPSKVKKVKVR